jgi:hypothetical protein
MLPSSVFPNVFTEINPPGIIFLSKEDLSTTRSLIIEKAFALQGSIYIVSPLRK